MDETQKAYCAQHEADLMAAAERIDKLERERARLAVAAAALLEELEDRYDGAPDSGTRWMGLHIEQLSAALAGRRFP